MKKPRISVVLPILTTTPFLRAMTEFTIKAMRTFAAEPFELIVVEAEEDNFVPWRWEHDPMMRIDTYHHYVNRNEQVHRMNEAIAGANADIVAVTGNDIIMVPKWDELLMEPFARFADCGISCLSAREPGTGAVGPHQPMDLIVEGWYTPLMAFHKRLRFDATYPMGWFTDADLVMRVYAEGNRAYRHCGGSIIHLSSMTINALRAEEKERNRIAGQMQFYEKWGNSPLMAFAVMRVGGIAYGREHEAWTRPHPVRELK